MRGKGPGNYRWVAYTLRGACRVGRAFGWLGSQGAHPPPWEGKGESTAGLPCKGWERDRQGQSCGYGTAPSGPTIRERLLAVTSGKPSSCCVAAVYASPPA